MVETHLLTGSLEPTNEPYAIAKISAIKLCRYYNKQYGANFISIMPTNLYGQNFNLEKSHVLPALIRKFHIAKLFSQNKYDELLQDLKLFGNLPTTSNASLVTYRASFIAHHLSSFGISSDVVTLWGTGSPYREFLYVDDLAGACVFLMQNYNALDIGEFINIGTGEDIQIKDLVDLIKEIVIYKGKISWDTSKPDGMQKKLLYI